MDPLPRTTEGFIDWSQILPPTTEDEVKRVVTNYFGGDVPVATPATPAAAAQAAAGVEKKSEGPPPTDDDIPF